MTQETVSTGNAPDTPRPAGAHDRACFVCGAAAHFGFTVAGGGSVRTSGDDQAAGRARLVAPPRLARL